MLEQTYPNYEMPGSAITGGRVTPGEISSMTEHLALERWYALSVRVRHEKLVTRHLQYEGIHYFLPLYRSVRRWKDRRKELDLALFPGYLFVKVKRGDRMAVLRAPGVRQFVTAQGQPAVVAEAEIRALESSFAAGLNLHPHPYLCHGRRVRVTRGALIGTEGIMVRRKEGFRLVLSIALITRSVLLEVDEADVEPV
jgi:transcription antitermination factor NusG